MLHELAALGEGVQPAFEPLAEYRADPLQLGALWLHDLGRALVAAGQQLLTGRYHLLCPVNVPLKRTDVVIRGESRPPLHAQHS